jgi:hypothetical protein
LLLRNTVLALAPAAATTSPVSSNGIGRAWRTCPLSKNWPPFEDAVRDLVQLRIQRLQARQAGEQQQAATPFERLSQRADNMAKASAALKKVADAGAPLYQSLNDDQKSRFVRLARMLRPHHHMRWGHDRGWGEDRRDG